MREKIINLAECAGYNLDDGKVFDFNKNIELFLEDANTNSDNKIECDSIISFEDIAQHVTFQFKNIHFKNDLKLEFPSSYIFVNCTFENPLSISLDEFKTKISFDNCIFNKGLYVDGSESKEPLSVTRLVSAYGINYLKIVSSSHNIEIIKSSPILTFTGITFTNMTLTYFNTKQVFKKCTFLNDVITKGRENNLLHIKDIVFNSCEFKTKLDFSYTAMDTISFHNSKFKDQAIFYGATLTGCDFTKTKFEGEVDFKDSKLTNCDFTRTEFLEEVDFKDSTITNCFFMATNFKVEADFKDATFKEVNQFLFTRFLGRVAFTHAKFEYSPVVFDHLIMSPDTHMFFAKLEKDIPKVERIAIKNTVIKGYLDFRNDISDQLDLQGSALAGTLSRVNFDPKCANWETATILKNEEIKRNNLIKALEYKAEEKDLYKVILKYQIIEKRLYDLEHCIKISEQYLDIFKKKSPLYIFKYIIENFIKCHQQKEEYLNNKKKNLQTTHKYITFPDSSKEQIKEYNLIKLNFESFSLFMSWLSNDHGQDWFRALVFTIWVWIFSFTIFYLPNFLWLNIFILEITLGILLFCFKKMFSKQLLLYFFYFFSLLILLVGAIFFWEGKPFEPVNYLEGLIDYFVPTKYDTLTEYVINFPTNIRMSIVTIFGILVYFIGKIFIPYGIYEVITAFKKYNKID